VPVLVAEYLSVTAMGCLEILHFLQLGGMEGTSLFLELHFGLQMPCVSQLKREQNESIFIKNDNSIKSNLQIENLSIIMIQIYNFGS
jgi:hypothetical protein